MSSPIHVVAYSGYKANEYPQRFLFDDQTYEIAVIEDCWYDPEALFFKVLTVDSARFVLRYDLVADKWTLRSDFDGTRLLSRTGIALVTVEPTAVARAEQCVAGCERCRADKAEIPFDWLLAEVLHKHGAYEFLMAEIAHCPVCDTDLNEKTLVELRGGIETETLATS